MESSDEVILFSEVLKEFLTVEEGEVISLTCKLNKSDIKGNWLHNNKSIIPSDRITISSNGLWQTVEIKTALLEDEGVYCFALKAVPHDIYTKCIVIVKKQGFRSVTRYYPEPYGTAIKVVLPLCNCNVQEGDMFILVVEFACNVQKCLWYKNNELIPAKRPKFLLEDNNHTFIKLLVDNAKTTDTGLYSVVGKTYEDKYLSSYAEVLVTADGYVDSLYNNERIPHIWEPPSDCMEVYEMDDVILMFKSDFDIYTIMKWTKDGADIKFSDRISHEMYATRYISLKICDVSCADSGTYVLFLQHETSSTPVVSSKILTVKRYTQPRPLSVSVCKPLLPTVASVGEGITFRCIFGITDVKYTYVVWIIGANTIEKSTQRFKVINNENEFILYIPVVTPELMGEVTCQLRQHIPPRQSILLKKTSTQMVILPPQVVEIVDRGCMLIKENNVYCDPTLTVKTSGMSSCSRNPTTCSFNDTILQFQFSKMANNNFYFEMLNDDDEDYIESVQVMKKENTSLNAPYPMYGDWNISWVRPNKKEWYAIDLWQHGQYSEIGVSTSPSFDIKEPPEDKLFKFRIRTLRPNKRRINLNFSFIPEAVTVRESATLKEILPFKEYKKSYSTNIKIGQGSFGTVSLVSRRDGEFYTAKTTKFVEQSKWKQANREFDIMKTLIHPNTVALIDGFSRKNGNGLIFIMEYLWGGELSEKTIIGDLKEVDTIVYIRQILQALQYLHSNKIAHLDIRPENIICINRNSRLIKLIDFGMARYIEQPVSLRVMYGSKDFVSPEMIHKELISTYCDMWSLGVLTFWLLTRRKPFTGSNWIEMSSNISNVSYYFNETELKETSDNAKVFVSFLLRRQPDDRINALMALNCDWITRGPQQCRPTKIQVPIRGGMKFVEITTLIQSRWKVLTFVSLAVVRFRARRRLNLYLARRSSGKRYSARIAARRMNFDLPSTSY